MNLGFKYKLTMRSLFARIRYYAVESYVESYLESSVELRCKRRFEYVKVVPLSQYSTGLRALFRGDQVMMQPTMITLPSLPSFPSLLLPFSLWPQAPFPNFSIFFLITSDHNRHIGATSASLRIEDGLHTTIHCVHRLFTGFEPRGQVSAHYYDKLKDSHVQESIIICHPVVCIRMHVQPIDDAASPVWKFRRQHLKEEKSKYHSKWHLSP